MPRPSPRAPRHVDRPEGLLPPRNLCRVEKIGGRVFIEDLGTGTRPPAAEASRQEAPGLTIRRVRCKGRHVPLDPELVDGPDDPWYADDLEARFDHAEDFLKRLDPRLRSRGKGGGVGGELVELASGQEKPEPRLPDVRNAEGHRLVLTTLRWDVTREAGVRERLARVDGLELAETPAGLAGTFLKTQLPKPGRCPAGRALWGR